MTETLPGDTKRACELYSSWSSYRVSLLSSALKNAVRGHSGDFLYVWELQERGALHLHFVVAGDSTFLEWWDSNGRRLCWSHLLLVEQKARAVGAIRERPGRPLTTPENWQFYSRPVEKSLSSYLSKYLSKEEGKASSPRPRLGRWWPVQWWGRSRTALDRVRAYTCEIAIEQRDSSSLSLSRILRVMGKRCRSFPWKVWDSSTGKSHGTMVTARFDWGDCPGHGDDWLGSLWTVRELLRYVMATIPDAWARAARRNKASRLYRYISDSEIARQRDSEIARQRDSEIARQCETARQLTLSLGVAVQEIGAILGRSASR